MHKLREMGLCIAEDVPVIGYDDAKRAPEGLPRCTTVYVSHFETGYLAAELLLRQIESAEIARGNIWVRSYLFFRRWFIRRTGGSGSRRDTGVSLCL
jgi:DNA-binding LacI/PurR family transcriptional regulator